MRRGPLVLFIPLIVAFVISWAHAAETTAVETCKYPRHHARSGATEAPASQPLNDADRLSGPLDWTKADSSWRSCASYQRATCARKSDVLEVARYLALQERSGYSAACIEATERARCAAIADPVGGTTFESGIPVCANVCEEWFKACSEEFIAPAAVGSTMRISLPCDDSSVVCSLVKDLYDAAPSFCADMGVLVNQNDGWCATGTADRERRGKLVQLIATPTEAERDATTTAKSGTKARILADLQVLWETLQSLPSYIKSPQRLLRRLKSLDDTTIYAATIAVVLAIPINYVLRKLVVRGMRAANDDFGR